VQIHGCPARNPNTSYNNSSKMHNCITPNALGPSALNSRGTNLAKCITLITTECITPMFEPAAPLPLPTRDFVPWRFSAAGRLGSRGPRETSTAYC
jgi:hypothetical protein